MTRETHPWAEAQVELTVPRRGEITAAEGSAARAGCKRAAPTRSDAAAVRQLAGIATVVTVALIVVAVIVHLIGPAIARRLLGFAFPPDPPGLRAAWGIFTGNLRLAAAPLAGARLLQLADRDPGAFRPGRALLDAIIATILVGNVVVVAAGFGGYGMRMIRYVLPHGPVELAGYCCALPVYTSARTGRARARSAWRLSLATLVLLAFAAVLEATCAPL